VLAALREAIRRGQPDPGLIPHTDRGDQYAGSEYRQVLGRPDGAKHEPPGQLPGLFMKGSARGQKRSARLRTAVPIRLQLVNVLPNEYSNNTATLTTVYSRASEGPWVP
jgi:transposase InsO family protein